MKESEFQARVIGLAEAYGWQVWHVPAPMVWDARRKAFRPARGGAGISDLILFHHDPPRLVFMELKRKGGKLSERQQAFLQAAKLVAESSWTTLVHDLDGPATEKPIGVFAVWPEDEERVAMMLRTRVVS